MKKILQGFFRLLLGLGIFAAAGCFAAARASASEGEENTALLYEEYAERLSRVKTQGDIEKMGFMLLEEHIFPVILESFGQEELTLLPAMEEGYGRLVLFLADKEGNIVYKSDELEANSRVRGAMEQPVEGLAAVSFADADGDGLTDIILIARCVNDTGEYAGKPYKVGDVLFQGEKAFYRDWRISDKLNRFGMNKSARCILSFVRDGCSTEFLYTAATEKELLDNGFKRIEEQCYTRNFEKLGRLRVVPGSFRMSVYDIFMIYLINEQGDIVWSFQPMEDYDNLYSLKGMTCRDMDGDGMKDLVVLARYSYEGEDGELLVDPVCSVYYQRTGGFDIDTGFRDYYQCSEEDKLEELVVKIREYWGWRVETED